MMLEYSFGFLLAMDLKRPRQRVISVLVMVSLAMLTLLGSVSEPPEVGLDDISKVGGGETIRARGVVVDAWTSDAGSLSLVLADLGTDSTLRVVCSSGSVGVPVDIHIGDDVRATGELEVTGGRPTLWSARDDIELIRPSREALTLEAIADSWEMLVGDRFEVVGILVRSTNEAFRLMDLGGSVSIALQPPETEMSRFEGRRVLADAVLRLRPETMELILDARGLQPSA